MASMVSTEFVDCAKLPAGCLLEVATRNRQYQIECLGGGAIRISGHPEYCPAPIAGKVVGSIIERGQHLQFILGDRRPVTTSCVTRLRVKQPTIPTSVH